MEENKYDHLRVEKKWQNFWETNKTFSVENQASTCEGGLRGLEESKNNPPSPPSQEGAEPQKTFYALDMFPFPSGAGLHVGHPEGYTATDIICRKKRMEGYKVLHPMGWDAFGLPAENFAIKTGVHPKISTAQNIKNFTRQIKSLGFSYDWDREFSTTDEDYYKWSQNLFLKFYEKGLLYEDEKPLNWCPSCKVVCANEEVESGLHERCGNPVTKKSLKQWMFKITDYAERLLQDLEPINVVIMHGLGGVGQNGWMKQVGEWCTENKIQISAEDFPNTDTPKYDEWLKFFEEKILPTVTPQTIFIGHSLGCRFLQRYASEEKLNCGEIIFVAPSIEKVSAHPQVQTFMSAIDYDYEKIKNSAQKISMIYSDNDEFISFENFEKLQTKLDADKIFLSDRNHFSPSKNPQLPELMDILENRKKSILDWPEKIKAMQRNWIGKSTGINIEYPTLSRYTKRGTKRGNSFLNKQKGNQRSAQITNIVYTCVLEVKQKNMKRLKITDIQNTYTINEKKIIFDGFELWNTHWKNKSRKDKEQREKYATTVIKALPFLWYETDSIAFFRVKNNIYRVVFDTLNTGELRVKTYYKDFDLSKEYQKRKANNTLTVTCYTTRPDTNFGATFVTLAPEHTLITENLETLPNAEEVKKYVTQAVAKSDIERMAEGKVKTGVFTGLYVLNRVNNKKLPLYVGDFVLDHVGTGAVVGVPGHDVRDFEFAQAMGIDVVRVVISPDGDESEITRKEQVQEHAGKMMNSDFLDGMEIMEAKEAISSHYVQQGWATRETNYRLRDWIFTRQRYWGEPIPLIHCEKCGTQPVSPLLKYEDEYFGNREKGSAKRCSNGTQREELINNPQNTSISVSILNASVLLCKLKVNNIYENRKIFEKGEKIIDTKIGRVYCNWKWIGTHFWKERRKNFYIRSRYKDIVVEILENYAPVVDKSGDYIFLGMTNFGKIIKIVVSKNKKGYFLKTFFIFQGFTKRIQPYLPQNILPLKLPKTANYEPSESGESPLAKISDWVDVDCPCCSGKAKRETSTMPNWAGSSWYWLRYMDAKNDSAPWSPESEKQWGPVDLYVGGAEHAVLHLLYARFWHKALYDMGLVSTKEPFKKLVNQGMILSYAYQNGNGGLVPTDEVMEKDGKYFDREGNELKKIVAKMSKSLKNVVNPDEIVEAFGADTLRMYEMFMGPFEQNKAWETTAVEGMYKFLMRIWRYFSEKEISDSCPSPELIKLTHYTVKKVTADIDDFKFNTAISQMMVWMNAFQKLDHIPRIAGGKFVRLLAPFAPHLAEEIWQKFSPQDDTISFVKWPSYDEKFLVEDSVKYAVQVNGKLRGDFEIAVDSSKEDCILAAKKLERVMKFIDDAGGEEKIRKEIFVPGRIVGFVVK